MNNFIQLTGFLGEDAKAITKNDKSYTILNLATNDNYRVQVSDKIEWRKKETTWHDLFVFLPSVCNVAKTLKKGNRISVTGEIAYKSFKDEKGYQRKQAYIVANCIEKLVYEKQELADKSITQEFVDDLIERFAA